jgi:uncharacterized protein YwlG (UPF0340 family)
MGVMGGDGPESDRAEIARMQEGLKARVLRFARGRSGGLREISPPVLLSLLCAAAFCPLVAGGAAVAASVNVLSSVGSGVLSAVIVGAIGRMRSEGKGGPAAPADLEEEIAGEIQRVLAAGDANAEALRAEIAAVLERIDAGGTVLRAAIETGNERVCKELMAAIIGLGSGVTEMGFLIADVARSAAEIQRSLDEQGAYARVIVDQSNQQAASIRLVREDLAVLLRLALTAAPGEGVGEPGPRWTGGCPYRGLLPFRETDVEVFYGREVLTADLTVQVAARLKCGGLLVVTGVSGAGKSSLLRAGLLPAIARGVQVEGSRSWPCRIISPGGDPLTELAVCLAALGHSDAMTVRDSLVRHPDQAHLEVRSAIAVTLPASPGNCRPVTLTRGWC